MNIIDYILIVLVAVCLFFAIRYMVKHKGSCCGSSCSGCSGNCSTCSKGKKDNKENKDNQA